MERSGANSCESSEFSWLSLRMSALSEETEQNRSGSSELSWLPPRWSSWREERAEPNSCGGSEPLNSLSESQRTCSGEMPSNSCGGNGELSSLLLSQSP